MLYPFAWVNRRRANGGCGRRLHAGACRGAAEAGGIEVIRDALIDDCALARKLKSQGPIWLGTDRTCATASVRIRRSRISGAWWSRSAYAQLRYSPTPARGNVAGMVMTYLVPPLMATIRQRAVAHRWACGLGLMAFAFQPTLRLYRLSPLVGRRAARRSRCLSDLHSRFAYQHARGTGRRWKGRVQANVSGIDDGPPNRDPARATADENFPVASWLISSAPSRHDPRFLRFRADRRRHRRSFLAARSRKARAARSTWRRLCSAGATRTRSASALRVAARDAPALHRATPRICSRRSAWT